MTQARYRLTGRLEAGELAELYQATRDDREKVVVKLFHPRTSDERYARVIADTVGKLQPLNDEAFARVVELGLARGRLAIVREQVDGFTLGQALQRLLTREVLMPPPVALYVVIQLLEAVQRAHEAGALHGAITPGNVLLGKDGRVALADFGALAALQAVPELKPFASRGRGAYRALEVTQGEAPTVASDVYSLGAIAYELLTLKEAVRASKTVSTRHEPLPPPSRLDRRINGRLDPIVMRAIETAPQRRFRSCAEFATALRNFLSATGGMPSKPELSRLVADLFPNEVQLQISKEIPFTDAVTLAEVSGAVLPKGTPLKEVLTMRPSFSGGELPAWDDDSAHPGAETIEGLPAFETYKGDDEPLAPAPPKQEPKFDEGTAPGLAGPLEKGWEAPPGAAPQKKKPAGVPLGASPAVPSALSPSLKSRFRVMEDFGDVGAKGAKDEATDTKADPRAQRPSDTATRKDRPEPDTSGIQSALYRMPSDESIPMVRETSGRKRPMITEEINLWRQGVARRRFAAVAIGIAIVGLFCFGLVVWRFGRSSSGRATPPQNERSAQAQKNANGAGTGASAGTGPSAQSGGVTGDGPRHEPQHATAHEDGAPSTGEVEADTRPLTVQPEPDEAEPAAPPRGNVAYLSIQSNVPARVYIDGKKVSRTTPLKRYKVEPGERKIVLESIRTGERKELVTKLTKNKETKFYERFETPGR